MKRVAKNMKKAIEEEVNYITGDGLELLKKEYDKRVNTDRNLIANKIDEARKFGDLSENSAYTTALEEKDFNEARIAELENLIHTSVVVKDKGDGRIGIGKTIDLRGPKGIVVYKIVGAEESDPNKNWISDKSPLGKSLLGKKQGDSVDVEIPSGKISYVIEKIS